MTQIGPAAGLALLLGAATPHAPHCGPGLSLCRVDSDDGRWTLADAPRPGFHVQVQADRLRAVRWGTPAPHAGRRP